MKINAKTIASLSLLLMCGITAPAWASAKEKGEKAGKEVGKAIDHAGEKAHDAKEKVKEKAHDAKEKVKEKIHDATEPS